MFNIKDEIIWNPRGVIVTMNDVVDGEELFNTGEALYSDERFYNIRYQIFDLTRVTEFNVSVDWMTKIAAWDKAAALSNPYMKLAIVATDETAQMLIKLYEAESSASTWKIQMFNSIDDAQKWVL